MRAPDTEFDAVMEKSPTKGGWTYVINDAVGTVRDGDAHDEFKRIWAAVHDAVDND